MEDFLKIGFPIVFIVLIVKYLFATNFIIFTQKNIFWTHYFCKKITKEHQQLLIENYTFYRNLKPIYKQLFDHRVIVFLSKTNFVAKQNMLLTLDVKLLIAASNVMLTFGMKKYTYTVFKAILVFPDSFEATDNRIFVGEFNPKLQYIAFSWVDFIKGINIDNNNLNLGIHEFSHALLFETHKKNNRSQTQSCLVFKEQYTQVLELLKNQDYSKNLRNSAYFRGYAFVNKVEFLAVVLEHFFETPHEFKLLFPDLYAKICVMINYRETIFV